MVLLAAFAQDAPGPDQRRDRVGQAEVASLAHQSRSPGLSRLWASRARSSADDAA
jgi:hypothetical protein